MLQYTCDKCQREDVVYSDWLPIVQKVHWCRTCVSNYFDELPQSEKFRASMWRDNTWEKMTPRQRQWYVDKSRAREEYPYIGLWQRFCCWIGINHAWFRETSIASYCLYCHKYKSEE